MILTTNGYYRIRLKTKGQSGSSYIGSYKTREEAEARIRSLSSYLRNQNFYSVEIEEMNNALRFECHDKKHNNPIFSL